MNEGAKLKRLARKFADATVNLSWLGAADPETHDEIREGYRKAKKDLYRAIDKTLETPTKKARN